jgi:transcriptional regulator with XRE-family HTH domain
VNQSFLSRALRHSDYKRPSTALMRAIAGVLGLPADYWVEVRESVVLDAVREDAALRDELYDRLRKLTKR